MPVIVTNQVRFQGGPGGQETAFTSAGNMLKTNAQPGYLGNDPLLFSSCFVF
jgi:hypothetical protein